MYRPTVRYDEVFKSYVDEIYKATTLDRNQIIRLALFAAPFNQVFITQIEKHLKKDVPPSLPLWKVWHHGYWVDQTHTPKEERRDARHENLIRKEYDVRRTEITKNREKNVSVSPERRERPVSSNERIRIRNNGGITIKIQ